MRGSIAGVMVNAGPEVDALLEGPLEVRDRLHRVGVPSTLTPGPRLYAAEPGLTVVPDRFWSTFPDAVTIGDFPPR